ncbi:MAG: hypothetical protein HRK26_00645 [Rickettsiaceae bacterium H1]|nr:hypothetical protein [Rickettsiaceae bacterium H1]
MLDNWKRLSYNELIGKFTNLKTASNVNHVKENQGLKGKINSRVYISAGAINQESANKFKENLANFFPAYVTIEDDNNGFGNEPVKITKFKIKKADLIRYRDDWLNNRCLRELAKLDGKASEYNLRLLTTLLATATNLKKGTYGGERTRKYEHDQRGGRGKHQQFLNWFYSEDGYPGRVDYEKLHFLLSAHKEPPVIFFDPEHIREKFTLEDGFIRIEVKQDNPLLVLFNAFPQDNKTKLKHEEGKLKGNFQDWKHFAEFLLGEGKEQAEILLKKHQQVAILKELDVNAAIIVKIKEGNWEINRNELVNGRITALEKSLKLFADKAFLIKFTKDKGVLQAEQYFNWLCANIHAEIAFLKTQVQLPEQDNFKVLHQEINQLLTIHDFLLYKDLVHRDAQINITEKEATDLFNALKEASDKKKVLSEHPVAKLLNLNKEGDLSDLTKFLEANNQWNKHIKRDFLEKLNSLLPKNLHSVKISSKLRIKQVLYNLTYYIPGSSLWLKHLHPANSRVETGFKGNSLYCSNKEIEETKISREIRLSLEVNSVDGSLSKFVPSKHEAKCYVSEFRKERNMMGAKERFIYRIKKHRLIWLPFSIGIFIFTVSLSITSRILTILGVIAPFPINTILNEFRGFTESVAIIFGLDTFLDFTVLRAIDFVALTVRYIDKYLFGSTIRSCLRLITGIALDIYRGIKYGIKSCWQSLIDHGLWGSLVIASDNVKSAFGEITKEEVKNVPKSVLTYFRNKIFTSEERAESIGFNIPIISLFYNLYKNYKEWKGRKEGLKLRPVDYESVGKSQYLAICPKLEEDKQCVTSEKAKLHRLKLACDSFASLHKEEADKINELKSKIENFTKEQNTDKLQEKYEEVRTVLNKITKKDELIKLVHAQTQITGVKQDLHNFAQNKERIRERKKDFSQVLLLQTALLHKKLFPDQNIDYQNPANSFIQQNPEGVKSADLQRKINIINSLIEKINDSKIATAQSITEPIFTINNEHRKLKLNLELYKSGLEQLKSHLNEKNSISPIGLSLLDYKFRHCLSNAFVLMNKGFNRLDYNGFHNGDLQKFVGEFGLATLLISSKKMSEIAANLRLYSGTSSSLDLAVRRFSHFVKEYQDPKRLLLCFLAISALEMTRARVITDTISDYMELVTSYLEILDQGSKETIVGNAIHVFYEKAELPRDLIAALIQFNEGLCDMEIAEEDEYDTTTRAKSIVNTLCSIIFTVIGINIIKSVIAEKGYDKKEAMQKCYTPYFATIGCLASGIPVAVLTLRNVAVNAAIIYTLFAISTASVITSFGSFIYSLTLPKTTISDGITTKPEKSLIRY